MNRNFRRPTPAWMVVLLACSCAGLLGLAGRGQPVSAGIAQSEGVGVSYAAGWNIVAAPTATELTGTTGPQYAYGADGTGYTPVRAGEIVGGRAVWAYFGSQTTLQLGRTAAGFTRILAPANQWVLAGNPSSSQRLPISGADVALAYNSARGYYDVNELEAGQGAWVLRFAAGDVYIGTAPSGATAGEVRGVQKALTGDAADPSAFGTMPGIASRLLEARAYDVVQEMMDDVRTSFQDGLRLEQAATVPPLSETQRSSMEAVRLDLATAMQASASGNTTAEAAAVADAKKKAQAAEDAAAQEARSGSATLAYARLSATRYTPQSLARYGALCIGTTPALSVALAPSSDFIALVVATLQGQPAPKPATPTPSPTPAPAASQPSFSLPTTAGQRPTNCNGGRVLLSPNAASSQQTKTVMVQYFGLDPNSQVVVYAYVPTAISPQAYVTGVSDGGGNGQVALSLPVQTTHVFFPIVAQTLTRCGQADFNAI